MTAYITLLSFMNTKRFNHSMTESEILRKNPFPWSLTNTQWLEKYSSLCVSRESVSLLDSYINEKRWRQQMGDNHADLVEREREKEYILESYKHDK